MSLSSASPSGAEFDGPEGGTINGPVEMISLEPEVKLTSTRRPVGIGFQHVESL